MTRVRIASDLLDKYGGAVPRYTSYPTALQFHPGIGGTEVQGWLRQSRGKASVYIHMAYCKALCLYCGCNMKVTNQPATITAYTSALLAEMDRAATHLPERLEISSIHFGGGTPSYAPATDIQRIFKKIGQIAGITPGAEIGMEMDPRQLPDHLPPLLAALGLNRASLGIQDTDPRVQQAIRREQPQALNVRAVRLLRAAGITNISVDLLYGLPLQTPATIRRTVADVLELAPARVSLFGYAHVPWMKKHQAVLEQYGLPSQHERMDLFSIAAEALLTAGYVTIGFDHFCRPDDSMALAAAAGNLHRNFMGYTVDDAPLLLGFGASAISQFPGGYAQNAATPADYMAMIQQGSLPVVRGVSTTAEDSARRTLIERLLCNMQVSGPELKQMVAKPQHLQAMLHDGLARWQGNTLEVTAKGRPFVRAVAACFDTYSTSGTRHSRI